MNGRTPRFAVSDYVFLNLFAEPPDRPMTKSAVRAMVGVPHRRADGTWSWTGLRGRSGVYFRLHWLRHTFATRLHESGVRLEVIGELLGHRSTQSTLVYTHPSTDSIRVEMEAAKRR